MTSPTLRRPLSAWQFIVDLVRAVTEPPADIAACDRRVEEIAADSAIAHAFSSAAAAWRRAADDSAVVAVYRRRLRAWLPREVADRTRAAGWIAASASVTALVLRLLSTERDPLTWALPSAVLVVALLTVAGADAIARALVHGRS
jgi:hypothetical protein